jgi:sugar/nucleoside kinase (ribokinase family)
VICLGEVMGELSLAADGSARVVVWGGDTFNTAIYLARSGIRAGFASMVGMTLLTSASAPCAWKTTWTPRCWLQAIT